MTNKNYILIDFIFENEENINNKSVNCYLKIFKEIIFISFCNNEFLKKEIFKKLKENYFYLNYLKKIYQ